MLSLEDAKSKLTEEQKKIGNYFICMKCLKADFYILKNEEGEMK